MTFWISVCLETPPVQLQYKGHNAWNWTPLFTTFIIEWTDYPLSEDHSCVFNSKLIDPPCGRCQPTATASETIYPLSRRVWDVIERSGTAVNILTTCVVPPEVSDLPVCSPSDMCAALVHVSPLFRPCFCYITTVQLTKTLTEMYVVFLFAGPGRDPALLQFWPRKQWIGYYGVSRWHRGGRSQWRVQRHHKVEIWYDGSS